MKALQIAAVGRRLGLARIASAVAPAPAATHRPARASTTSTDPTCPGPGWHRVRTRLAGICGCDLSTDRRPRQSRTSRPIVSFPFIPGHEVVGRHSTTAPRVVLEPVLGCVARGIDPPCAGAAPAATATTASASPSATSSPASRPASAATPAAAGHPSWSPTTASSTRARRHDRRARPCSSSRPPCGIHAALLAPRRSSRGRRPVVACSAPARSACSRSPASRRYVAAACASSSAPATRTSSALARALGADDVVRAAASSPRAVRRARPAAGLIGDQLTGGADVVDRLRRRRATRSPTALRITRPRGRVVLVGMPAEVTLDLTALWHRETELVGAYAYGTETLPDGTPRAHVRPRLRHRRRQPRLERLLSRHLPARRLRRRHRPRRHRRPPRRRQDRLRPPPRRRSGTADAPTRLRPRRRPLDAADPVLARRGLQPREAARRPQPGDLPARAARRRSTTSTAPSATRCSNPIDTDPLPALLFPGMKLTIAFDDISLPLPKMRRPDIRQRVIEAVLDLAADAGVDDVHLIAALALHRRMTEAELRHAVGDRVYDAFAPRGLLYNHDAEDPDNLAFLGTTAAGRGGRDQQAGGRERPARLRQHQPRRHGRRLEVDRHRPGLVPQPAPPPQRRRRCRQSHSFMDQHHSELHKSQLAHGQGACVDAGVKVFQIETTLNTDTFPTPFDFLAKREWEWIAARPRPPTSPRRSRSSARPTAAARARSSTSIEAPHQMTSVQAGEVEAVHQVDDRERLPPAARRGRGPDRHPHDGHPVHLPVQRRTRS